MGTRSLLALILASATVAANALPRPDAPDRGVPFLHTDATDLVQLVREVQRDHVARRRYAHFFHVPAAQVTQYLQQNFVPTTLPRTDTYTVSLVSARGTVYPVWMTLPAGTPVFASRHGTSLLVCATGDPATPLGDAAPAVPVPPPTEQIIIPTEEQIIPLQTVPVPTAPPAAP